MATVDRQQQWTKTLFMKTDFVTRTVWLRLPNISTNLVRKLRRQYTRAINAFLIGLEEKKGTIKEIYHKLRSNEWFSQLSAKMLNQASKEALVWFNLRRRERFLTDQKIQKWAKWAKKQGIPNFRPLRSFPRLVSHSDYLKGWPGKKRGQWPQTATDGARFYIDSITNNILVSIDKVAKRTQVVIGGEPEQLLRQAISGVPSLKIGSSRLLVKDGVTQMATPIRVSVNIPGISNLKQPTLIGVDLGLNTLAAAVALTFDQRVHPAKSISGKQLKHHLASLWAKRKKAARKQIPERLQAIDEKTQRVIQHWIHVTAKAVINYAIQFQHPIIVLEDLRNYIPTKNRTRWASSTMRDQLSKWARGKLFETICMKASLQNLPVIRVNAAYSSHVCPRQCLCLIPQGYFEVFHCPACGAKVPRDISAATEIARRGLHLVTDNNVWHSKVLGNENTSSLTQSAAG
ncbi:MAG: IS200/IS605 family accessory protein TnpB-related protein [Promethearchaeota archaeon]